MWNLEWDRLSVYPYNEENIQEVLCRIYSIIEQLKQNGQVVPPDLIPSVERLKQEMIEIKDRMSTEVQAKIDKAIQDLTNITTEKTKELVEKVDHFAKTYPQGNIITDPMINDYVQELTPGKNFERRAYYGPLKLYVKNGMGQIQGAVDIKSSLKGQNIDIGNEKELEIIKPWVAMKQYRNKPILSNVWSSGYDRNKPVMLELKNNGRVELDRFIWNLIKSDGLDTCITLDITFPIQKIYPYADEDSHSPKINSKIGIVEKKSNEMTSKIVLASDTHLNVYYDYETNTIGDYAVYMPTILNYANVNLGAFATIINGDVLTEKTGVSKKTDIEWLMHDTRRQFIDNTLFVLGNHDDMSLLQGVEEVTDKKKFNAWMNGGKTGINFATDYEPYFYADDTVGQCRHICLNSHDVEGKKIHQFKFGEEQLKWLIYALETTPKNYSVVCYCHVSPKISKDMKKNGGNDIINGDAVHSIFLAFREGSKGTVPLNGGKELPVDFKGYKGLFAGCISGHEHEDYEETIEGVNYIVEDTTGPRDCRDGRCVYHDKFTLLSVDGKNRRIRFDRLAFNGGAREDLVMEY